MTTVTPNKNGLQWGLVADAEFRSPLETKTVALSVRRTIVTGSDKKAKLGEKQTPDPKTGRQSQLEQLEARMKEQLKQIQHQVTCECHPVPTNLLIMAVYLGALASEFPQTRAETTSLTESIHRHVVTSFDRRPL
jgi:hypothetical protein